MLSSSFINQIEKLASEFILSQFYRGQLAEIKNKTHVGGHILNPARQE